VKYLIIGLAVVLLIAAKPQDVKGSWYSNPAPFSEPMPANEKAFVNEFMVQNRQEGFVTLEGDTFTPNWTGLMKVSGFCRVKYPVDSLAVFVGGYYVAKSSNEFVTFTATIPAEPVKIGVVQSVAGNYLQCNLLFEAVK